MTSPSELVDNLFADILSGTRSVQDLDEDEVTELRTKLNPYGQAIKLENNRGQYFAYSLINLKEEYMKKYITTAIIGFLFRRADEWGVPDGDYITRVEDLDEEEVTRSFIEENVVKGKVVLKKEKTAGVSGGEEFVTEESNQNRFRRMIIHQFLKEQFTFNPDKHVRSAYQRNKDDPERKKIDTKKKHTKPYRKGETVSKSARLEHEYGNMVDHIPSADLFHYLTYYMDSNHDAIRIATRNLYSEKPDLDYTAIIYDSFPTIDEYNKFVHKHESEVTAQVRCCVQNQWTFQTSCTINRERQQMYNRHNRILQDILDTVEANQRLGKDIMHQRIKRKKKQNVEECGPDDEKFLKQYKKEQRNHHKKAGLREQTERERQQRDLEEKYINKFDKPSPMLDDEEFMDAIEVQTWTHDTKNKTMRPESFFTKSENIDADKAAIHQAK